MKKLAFLSTLLIALVGQSFSQKIINGIAKDASNKQPLVGVIILVDGTNIGAVSDANGRFQVSGLAAGNYKLSASHTGYKPLGRQVNLMTKDTVFVELAMTSKENNSESVEVVGAGQGAVINSPAPVTESMNITTTKSYKGAGKAEHKAYGGTTGYSYQKGAKMNYSPAAPDFASVPDLGDFKEDTTGNNDYRNVVKNPFSTFSIDVDDGSYALMRKNVNGGVFPSKDEVRTEEFINYFDYKYPLPKSVDTPFNVYTEISNCPWNPSNKLMHIGIQGYDVEKTNLPASNLVFLIDVSGSMWSQDKLPLVKKAFGYLVDQLRSDDIVSVVVYAGSSGLALPPTKGNDKSTIKDVINRLEAGGSTAGGAGIQLAYKIAKENFIKDGNNRVILATDGDFNVGISDDEGLVKLIEEKRNDGIFLSVVGCGTGNYQDKKMEQLADHGNGYYGYVDDEAEAKRIFVKQMGATILTIAKDVKLQVEFNPKLVKEYKLIGYENRILKDQEFIDDKKDAGELGAGSSVTALYEIVLFDQPKENREVEQKDKDLTYATFEANDLVALNIRYKEPKESKSKLTTQMIKNTPVALDKTSDDFRFSAAVAMTGMILKGAVNKGNSTFDMAYALASASKGTDKDGYRNEFVELLKKMQGLKSAASAK